MRGVNDPVSHRRLFKSQRTLEPAHSHGTEGIGTWHSVLMVQVTAGPPLIITAFEALFRAGLEEGSLE